MPAAAPGLPQQHGCLPREQRRRRKALVMGTWLGRCETAAKLLSRTRFAGGAGKGGVCKTNDPGRLPFSRQLLVPLAPGSVEVSPRGRGLPPCSGCIRKEGESRRRCHLQPLSTQLGHPLATCVCVQGSFGQHSCLHREKNIGSNLFLLRLGWGGWPCREGSCFQGWSRCWIRSWAGGQGRWKLGLVQLGGVVHLYK